MFVYIGFAKKSVEFFSIKDAFFIFRFFTFIFNKFIDFDILSMSAVSRVV